MANLTSYEQSALTRYLQHVWAKVSGKFYTDDLALDEQLPASDLAFSWQNFIEDENLNTLADLDDEIIGLPSTPHFRKELINDADDSVPQNKIDDCLPLSDESPEKVDTVCVIDRSSSAGDVATLSAIKGLLPHELPVKGTFIHPRIVQGFSYVVRPVDSYKPFFNGKAQCLQKIGTSYGKRLTFSGDRLHDNPNYFWSDSNPEGFGLSLELVHVGDKYTVLDSDNHPVASVEVTYLMDSQKETDESIKSDNKLEKQAYVSMQCRINYFEDPMSSGEIIIVSGVAVAVKNAKSSAPAQVVKVRDCFINGNLYTLVPTTPSVLQRSKIVSESNIVAKYSIAGLLPNELPVIGTYVDPRITPGFKYRVRSIDSNKPFFGGRALTLKSIGKGYGKRITFEGESISTNENYFWSDSNPQGCAFTLEAVSEGDSFKVINGFKEEIGEALVYKLCGPQIELESSFDKENKKYNKKVKVSLACHLLFHEYQTEITTRVQGIALIERKNGQTLVRGIEKLEIPYSFDSHLQLNGDLTFLKF